MQGHKSGEKKYLLYKTCIRAFRMFYTINYIDENINMDIAY